MRWRAHRRLGGDRELPLERGQVDDGRRVGQRARGPFVRIAADTVMASSGTISSAGIEIVCGAVAVRWRRSGGQAEREVEERAVRGHVLRSVSIAVLEKPAVAAAGDRNRKNGYDGRDDARVQNSSAARRSNPARRGIDAIGPDAAVVSSSKTLLIPPMSRTGVRGTRHSAVRSPDGVSGQHGAARCWRRRRSCRRERAGEPELQPAPRVKSRPVRTTWSGGCIAASAATLPCWNSASSSRTLA